MMEIFHFLKRKALTTTFAGKGSRTSVDLVVFL